MSQETLFRSLSALQFNVAQLLKQATGASRSYEVDIPFPELDEQLILVAPLRGHVHFLRVGLGILASGTFSTVVELTCMRCLSEFHLPIEFEVEEEFTPTIDIVTGIKVPLPPDQDTATLIDEHHILDLTEVIRQDVWLSLPNSPICHPDCKGLCPYCGQNRNLEECNCRAEEIDARWISLLRKRHILGE
ncbi:MAG: YceD family protein [Anaerolineae bacterium]